MQLDFTVTTNLEKKKHAIDNEESVIIPGHTDNSSSFGEFIIGFYGLKVVESYSNYGRKHIGMRNSV